MMDRINLTLPKELNEEVVALSRKHGIPVVDVIRRFIKLGILEDQSGPFAFIDDKGQETIIEVHPSSCEKGKYRLW